MIYFTIQFKGSVLMYALRAFYGKVHSHHYLNDIPPPPKPFHLLKDINRHLLHSSTVHTNGQMESRKPKEMNGKLSTFKFNYEKRVTVSSSAGG